MENESGIEKLEKLGVEYLRVGKYFLGFVLVLILGYYFLRFIGSGVGVGTNEDLAAFGDYIGGLLNPLLTFFTILILLYSIRLQQRELKTIIADVKTANSIGEKGVNKQEIQLILQYCYQDFRGYANFFNQVYQLDFFENESFNS